MFGDPSDPFNGAGRTHLYVADLLSDISRVAIEVLLANSFTSLAMTAKPRHKCEGYDASVRRRDALTDGDSPSSTSMGD